MELECSLIYKVFVSQWWVSRKEKKSSCWDSSPLLSSPGLSVGISMATERWSGLVWRVQTVSATAVMARPAWQQQPHYSCHDSLEWGRHGTGRHVCLAARFVMILHLSLSLSLAWELLSPGKYWYCVLGDWRCAVTSDGASRCVLRWSGRGMTGTLRPGQDQSWLLQNGDISQELDGWILWCDDAKGWNITSSKLGCLFLICLSIFPSFLKAILFTLSSQN